MPADTRKISGEDPVAGVGGVPEIHPEMRNFLDRVGAGATSFYPGAIDVASFRARADASREALFIDAPNLAEVRDFSMATSWGSVPAILMRARPDIVTPAILYLHGGGWTIGSIKTHRRLMLEYAVQTGFAVIGLDYALAPEAPFPAAVYQCVAALASIGRMAAELRVDPGRIAIAGDSAGANLAVATALAASECGAPMPRAIIASYGVYDSDFERPSYHLHDRPDLLLNRSKMIWFWDQYTRTPEGRRHPLASPLHADLRTLPPLYVTIAEIDVLADENRDFVRTARAEGIAVDVGDWPGTVHAFLEAIGISSLSRRALSEQCHWLTTILSN